MQEMQVQSLVGKVSWRRKRLPTPVLLPRKSHGWRSLAGYSPWGDMELSTTWWLNNCYYHAGKLSTEWLLNWLKLTQQGEVEWGFNAQKSEWRANVYPVMTQPITEGFFPWGARGRWNFPLRAIFWIPGVEQPMKHPFRTFPPQVTVNAHSSHLFQPAPPQHTHQGYPQIASQLLTNIRTMHIWKHSQNKNKCKFLK